ncbi:MAG: photosystem II stability/assembly factor-like uncharacterized protein [Planctomycetota bacterium]
MKKTKWIGLSLVVLAGCAGTKSKTDDVGMLAPVEVAPVQLEQRGVFEKLDVEAVAGASLRGLSVPEPGVVWVSGSGGKVARSTDSGASWTDVQIPEAVADDLDLRCIVAFDELEAWAASAGEGSASRLFHTTDGGASWTTVLRNEDPAGFFDGLAFWDRDNGLLLGDPTDGYLTVLVTTDGGSTWSRMGDAQVFALPAPKPVTLVNGELSVALSDEQKQQARAEAEAFSAEEGTDAAAVGAMLDQQAAIDETLAPLGEYCFAASNQSIATMGRSTAWIGTGGKVARVFKTQDRGRSWTVAETPLAQGDAAAGVFALDFADFNHGVAVGGNYTLPDGAVGNCAVTSDGGATWQLAATPPPGYRSSVRFLPGGDDLWISAGTSGANLSEGSGGDAWPYATGTGSGAALNSVTTDPLGRAVWCVGADGYVGRMPSPSAEIVWE